MNKNETNRYNMYLAVKAVMEDYVEPISEYPALADAVSEFNLKTAKISETDRKYALSIGGKTNSKNNSEEELIEDLFHVKSALYAFAVSSKNEELKSLSAGSESALRKMRDTDLIQHSELIKNAGTQYLSSLAPYKITDLLLNALGAKITAYKRSIEIKDAGFADRGALRAQLTSQFDSVNQILNERIDSLMEAFKKSNSQFYLAYFSARGIKDLGLNSKKEPVAPPVG